MRIINVKIKNYKSLKEVDINFTDHFALVWFNCAGKSNILRAINFVLGESYPMWQKLSKKDFFNEDENNKINIQIQFDENIHWTNWRWEPHKWNIIEFWYDNSKSNYSLRLISTDGEYFYLNDEQRKEVACIYISANRDFQKNLESKSEWSILWKIINYFNEHFPEEKIDELNTKFEELKQILEEESFIEFERELQSSFSKSMLKDNLDLNLEIKTFNPKSFYKTIELIPEEVWDIKDLDQLGDGLKNSILFSLIQTYSKVVRSCSIFLIEEPEIYLHPQARLDMYNQFKSMCADNWSQIIYTTHSQEILHTDDFEKIWVVRKIDWESKISQIQDNFIEYWEEKIWHSSDLEQIKNFISTVSDAETNKWFFAKKIIIVEWLTEKWSLPIFAKKFWLYFEKENFEIISCWWKENISTFYNLFIYLGYEIYVIFDADKEEDNEKNEKIINLISDDKYQYDTKITDKYCMFQKNFDKELEQSLWDKFTKLKSLCHNSGKKHILSKHIAINLTDKEIPSYIKLILGKIFLVTI